MFRIVFTTFIMMFIQLLAAVLCLGAIQEVFCQITTPPGDVVAEPGETITLQCRANPGDRIYWLEHITSPLGRRIYDSDHAENGGILNPDHLGKYEVVEPHDLTVHDASLEDGGVYNCQYAGDGVPNGASVIIIEPPELMIPPLVEGVTSVLSCTSRYGSPEHGVLPPEQMPSIQAMIDGEIQTDGETTLTKGSDPWYTLRYELNYTAVSSDNGKDFSCIVATQNPPFQTSTTQPLVIQYVAETYEYAASCMPSARPSREATCTISITSAYETQVQIHTFEGSSSVPVFPDVAYQREFGAQYIPSMGVGSKAILVTSDVELQVLVYKSETSYPYYDDVYMVPDQRAAGNTYLTTAYSGPGADGCESPTPYMQFLTIASFYNETMIRVTRENGATYQYELPPFGTFHLITSFVNDYLASGAQINSSKPVNVVAGNGCVNVHASFGSFASSITSSDSLGREYIVPKIISEYITNPGYSVSIVATEDNTFVLIDGDSTFLDRGETAFFDYSGVDRSIVVTCSRNCLVAQYSAGVNDWVGIFMQQILPQSQFSTFAHFTTLYDSSVSHLTIVLTGEDPGDELYLDGASLGSRSWTALSGYAYAEMAISSGVHDLESRDGRPFTVYVYRHMEDRLGGSGYAMLPMTSSAPTTPTSPSTPSPSTPSPSTPAPSVNGTFPQHTARVNGTALTEDMEDISPACAVAHLNNLDAKTKGMIVAVNEAIGESICLQAPDMRVQTARAVIFNQGNQALLAIDHNLQVQSQHLVGSVESCAEEVAEYLNDLSHWQQPIFPDEAGCSRLLIDPPYFNTSGTFWSCDNQDTAISADNYLSYESKVSEVLATVDGSNLDVSCTLAYVEESSKKTSSMLNEISSALQQSGCNDIVTSVTHAESFTIVGDKAYFLASFYYVPNQAVTFGEFVTCMELVHEFTLEHENWSPGSQPGAPFLPVPPGCPALEHEGTTLDDEGRRWTCV